MKIKTSKVCRTRALFLLFLFFFSNNWGVGAPLMVPTPRLTPRDNEFQFLKFPYRDLSFKTLERISKHSKSSISGLPTWVLLRVKLDQISNLGFVNNLLAIIVPQKKQGLFLWPIRNLTHTIQIHSLQYNVIHSVNNKEWPAPLPHHLMPDYLRMTLD